MQSHGSSSESALKLNSAVTLLLGAFFVSDDSTLGPLPLTNDVDPNLSYFMENTAIKQLLRITET